MFYQYLQLHWIIAGYGYITRRADSEGVALGALSVPWACTGLILMGWRYAVETGQRPQSPHWICDIINPGSAAVNDYPH